MALPNTFEFWKDNAHKSGEELARENRTDGGSARRAKRRAMIRWPSLPWAVNQEHTQVVYSSPVEPHRRTDVLPSSRKHVDVERNIVINDLHIPFHDPRAVSIALAVVADLQPAYVTYDGDICDFYAVSKFNKDPKRATCFQEELDESRAILTDFVKAAPNAKHVFVRGNHEARLENFLRADAPALSGLRDMTVQRQLGLDELGIEYVAGKGREAYTTYGPIRIGHFNKVAKNSAYTAKLLLDKNAESLVQGHTHRLGTSYRTYPGGRMIVGVEGGCLCDLDPEYVSDPDWQQGFTIITKLIESDRFHVQQVPIVGYEAFVNDTRYSA